MSQPVPARCVLLTEGMTVEFNFLSIGDTYIEYGDHILEVAVTLSSLPEFKPFTFESHAYHYSIDHLRLFTDYFEAHLSRIADGIQGPAAYSLLLYQCAFMVEAQRINFEEEFPDETSFGLRFFVNIGGVGRPNLFVGFDTNIYVSEVKAFLTAYQAILNRIENYLAHGRRDLFSDLKDISS